MPGTALPTRAPPAAFRRPTLVRDRVTERIHAAAAYGIALMLAPAGFGKSEALRQAFDGTSALIVSLDDRNSTVESFLQELAAALGTKQLRSFASLVESTPHDRSMAVLLPWIASRLRTLRRAIVVDDVQRVLRDDRAAAALQELIESTRASVPWFLASREQPALPVGTWIASGWMHTPLSARDLSFTPAEIAALAASMQLSLDAAAVSRLHADTAGWPIAVQLALANWGRTATHVAGGLRTQDVLFAFIDEQIWSTATPAEQRLLELAALLPRSRSAVLARAGYPSAGVMLERLARRFTLIERDADGEFTLHDAFREFVTERLRRDEARYAETIHTLAQALAGLGLHGEALGFFANLRASREILDLLERSGYDMLEGGERAAVASALAALDAAARNHPVAAGLRGSLHLLNGAFTNAEADLQQSMAPDASARFRLRAGQRLATFWLNRGRYAEARDVVESLLAQAEPSDPDAIELSSIHAAVLGETGETARALTEATRVLDAVAGLRIERRPHVLTRVAAVCYRAGQIAEAEAIGNEAATLAADLGLDGVAAKAYSVLYAIAEETQADTTAADLYARAMDAAAANAGDTFVRVASLERLLYTATIRGDDAAIEAAEREIAKLGQVRMLRDTMQTRAGKVIREIGRGRHRQARRLLETIDQRDLSKSEIALRDALYALACIANKEPSEAAAAVARRTVFSAESDFISRRSATLAAVYRGLAQWLLGQQAAARRTHSGTRDALSASDIALVEVIEEICSTPAGNPTVEFVNRYTQRLVDLGMSGHARFLQQVIVPSHTSVRLTKTEIALLRAWRVGDTIQDLAVRLGRSPNTVNSHMGAVYRKTGASTRLEALHFAKTHGLT
jgi:LuxR family maltose regulon positive regulatory protein